MATSYIPNYSIQYYELKKQSVVAITNSAFSGYEQVYKHTGEWLTLDVALPAMKREKAAKWRALLGKLRGRYETFYFAPFNERFPASDLNLGPNLITTAAQAATSVNPPDEFEAEGIYGATVKHSATPAAVFGWQVTGLDTTKAYLFSVHVEVLEGPDDMSGITSIGLAADTNLNIGSPYANPPAFTAPGWAYAVVRPQSSSVWFQVRGTYNNNKLRISNASVKEVKSKSQRLNYTIASNNAAPNAFPTFSGATATGFTAGNDGLGSEPTGQGATFVFDTHPEVTTYEVSFNLTINSGSGNVYCIVTDVANDFTTTSARMFTASAGSNRQVLYYADTSVDATYYVRFFVDKTTVINFTVSDFAVKAVTPNCKLATNNSTFRNILNVSTATNTNFDTFTNGTTSGFDVTGDGSSDEVAKFDISDLDLVEGEDYEVSFDVTVNSGTLGNMTVGMQFSATTTYSGPGTWDYIKGPLVAGTNTFVLNKNDGQDINYINFMRQAGSGSVNLTISNFVLRRYINTGGLTASQIALYNLIPSQPGQIMVGDFLELANGQLVEVVKVGNVSAGGTCVVDVFPSPRGTLTADTLVKRIFPKGKFRLDENIYSNGVTNPGGIITGLGFGATESISQT